MKHDIENFKTWLAAIKRRSNSGYYDSIYRRLLSITTVLLVVAVITLVVGDK